MTFKMIEIPAGSFLMGSPETEPGRYDDEGPQHYVTIAHPFYMAEAPVTRRQWMEVTGADPSKFTHDWDCPVENVRWNMVQTFIKKLNQQTGEVYRLPSDAEWEYACRAGSRKAYYFGGKASKLKKYAWYWGNSRGKTQPVKRKKPNAWGLYDMHGNVLEWVQDAWHWDYYGAPVDGSAWETGGDGSLRVLRGGSWYTTTTNLRAAFRNWDYSDLVAYGSGFRLVRDMDRIRIGNYSPPTDPTLPYLHGTSPRVGMGMLVADADVIAALVSCVTDMAPNGGQKEVRLGSRRYLIRVTPVDETDEEAEK